MSQGDPTSEPRGGVQDALRAAVERTIAATAETAATTRQRAQSLVEEAPDSVRGRARELLDEVARRGVEAREEVARRGQGARDEVARQGQRTKQGLSRMGLATGEELAAVSRRLGEIEERLARLEAGPKSKPKPEG